MIAVVDALRRPPALPPPGWYPDPWRQAWWRWWDGAAWTPYTDRGVGGATPTTGLVVGASAPAVGATRPVRAGASAPSLATAPPIRAGGIATLGLLGGMVLAALIGAVLIAAGLPASSPAVLLVSTAGLWTGMLGACVTATRRRGRGSLADLGLVRPRGAELGAGLGLGVATLFVVGRVATAIHALAPQLLPHGRSDITDPIRHYGLAGSLVILVIAVVGAPFFEELFFRGLVQGTLVARLGPVPGVAVQAVLFGLVHMTPDGGLGNVGTVIVITCVGVALGTIRAVSRRLAPGMVTHATYNAILIALTIATYG